MKNSFFLSKTYAYGILMGLLVLGCSGPDRTTDTEQEKGSISDTATGNSSAVENGLLRITTKNGGHMEGMMVAGKRSGAWVAFFPDGTVQSKANYADGIEVGPTEVYHANGNVYYSGQYTNGQPSGEWVFHGQDGAEMKRVVYDENGVVVK